MKPTALLASVVITLAATVPALASPRSFSLGQWGQLEIDVPAGWTAESQRKDAPGGFAIRIAPPKDVPLTLLMTPMPAPGSAAELDTAVREAVEEAKPRLAKAAVESELPVRELRAEGGLALYVSATDKTVEKPTATQFKFIDQGVAAVGRFMVSFTVLTNAKDAPERAQALAVVRSARQVLPGPPWRTAAGGVAMSYPGKAWKLALDLPGFEVDPFQVKPGGKGARLTARNAATGMIVSAFLEEAHAGWTAVENREDAWKAMQADAAMDRQDVKRSERGPLAILEMRVPTYWGREVNQHNVNAYLVRDGVRADVHISKVKFTESDRELFEKVLGSVRIVE
jgi:hypothetical protein